MIYFLALIPATGLTIAGYFVLFLSNRSEGAFRAFGKYLGFWAFTLAGLVLLGAIFAAAHGGHHHCMGEGWMHGRSDAPPYFPGPREIGRGVGPSMHPAFAHAVMMAAMSRGEDRSQQDQPGQCEGPKAQVLAKSAKSAFGTIRQEQHEVAGDGQSRRRNERQEVNHYPSMLLRLRFGAVL